jgi:hypothetical protein
MLALRVTGEKVRRGEAPLNSSVDSEVLRRFDALHSKHMDLIEKLESAELQHAEDRALILELRAALEENVREGNVASAE